MISLLKSRHVQFSVLVGSLLFVLVLSASMWVNAFSQRSQAYQFKQVDAQEEMLFELSDALAAERQQIYGLLNSKLVDSPSVIKVYRQLSSTDELAERVQAVFPTLVKLAHAHTTSAIELSESDASKNSMAMVMPMQDAHENHTQSSANTIESTHLEGTSKMYLAAAHQDYTIAGGDSLVTPAEVLENLRKNSVEVYEQLLTSNKLRNPMFGMNIFHDYNQAIESLDELRQTLHTESTQSLAEHYIVTKLKDAFWEFRESSSQTMSLLEGITASLGVTRESATLNHHATMLIELNAHVDHSWKTLYKTIAASGNETMLADANTIAIWYNENFKRMSFGLMAKNRDEAVTVDELQTWLDASHRLSFLSEDVRIQSALMTKGMIDTVVRRTNVNLIRVSVLVLLSLCMTLASVFFFRRADRQAHQDELTRLDNRRMFLVSVDRCLSADSETGILMIDLDRFKHINDTMGHSAGDALLKDVSRRIAKAGCDCVSVSRLGGDEFAMLFNADSIDTMQAVASSVRQSLIEPFQVGGAILKIGSSIGLAKAPRDANTADALIQAADLAMYCAKKSGTNQISVYDSDVDQSMMIAARTVSELQTALINNEFELYYQPQFNIAKAQVLSAEALIRWNHPERGFLTPNHFISIAEENGLMPSIGDWVIEEACRQAAEWFYEKNMPLRVAINISADHFFQPGFVQLIVDSLEKYKLPPQLLEVEVTESVAMSDINLVVESLQQLRDLSIHVALDDFGTGYSSLSYLQELPLDTLKIDKSFIQNMLQGNVQKESITETIIALGNRLNLETVAEGVETVAQLTAVSDMQISVVQGYYYSRPVSATELEFVVKQLNDSDGEKKAA